MQSPPQVLPEYADGGTNRGDHGTLSAMTSKNKCKYCGRPHIRESDVVCEDGYNPLGLPLAKYKMDLTPYLDKANPERLAHLGYVDIPVVKEEAVKPYKHTGRHYYKRGSVIGSVEIYERMLFNFWDYCHMPSKKSRTVATLARLNEYERRNKLRITDPTSTKRRGKWRG